MHIRLNAVATPWDCLLNISIRVERKAGGESIQLNISRTHIITQEAQVWSCSPTLAIVGESLLGRGTNFPTETFRFAVFQVGAQIVPGTNNADEAQFLPSVGM